MPRWPTNPTPEELEARKARAKEKASLASKAYRQRHLEKLRAKDREKKAELLKHETPEQAEKRKARMRAYQAANTAKLTAQKKAYYATNPEAAAVRDAKIKEWHENNAEKMAEARKVWHAANKDKMKAYMVEYRKRNNQRISARKRERYHTEIENKISRLLRNRLYNAVKRGLAKGSRGGSAIRDLGCSVQEFILYIQTKFTVGMAWENWGEWHMDHIIPISKFDLTDREQFLKACHYTNLQPLWAEDNLSKADKIPAEPTEHEQTTQDPVNVHASTEPEPTG